MLPNKLGALHMGEQGLREKAEAFIAENPKLQLHLTIVEHAMDLADWFRKIPINDEDLKVLQIMGMRTFNAFGASLNLALSGYFQNSALIMRDILETVFLLNYFSGDRAEISRWRLADKAVRKRQFAPVHIRTALDKRDGFTERRRQKAYEMFCELAAHPTMQSDYMMRPNKDGDAVIGPFMEITGLDAVLSEMGRLAVQVGTILAVFLVDYGNIAAAARKAFDHDMHRWLKEFYGRE